MSIQKSGVPMNKIQDYLGEVMTIDLKNRHQIKGNLAFYHLTEQMIHVTDWSEYDQDKKLIRQGKYMVINRTAWFQLFK